MTFRCVIAHGSSIELKDIEVIDNIDGSAMKVPDVIGMILSDAETKLKELEFANIKSEGIGADIWDHDNWLVQSQSVTEGSKIDRHEEIVLTCLHLDDYFNDLFTGKTLTKISFHFVMLVIQFIINICHELLEIHFLFCGFRSRRGFAFFV